MFPSIGLTFAIPLIFSLSLPATTNGLPKLPVLGIIGGNQARNVQFPYQVFLESKKSHICGGAIIAPKIIITAAHCTRDEPMFGVTVVAGTTNRFSSLGTRIRIETYKEHPKYIPKTNEYDLAIVFLQKAFKYGRKIQPIELPKAGEEIPDGAIVTVSGWGVEDEQEGDKPADLKFTHLPIWKKSECYKFLKIIKASVYCAGDKSGQDNACTGDSGGPLVYDKKLFGVVSFGFGCGKPNKPSIHTDVAKYRDWIKKTSGI